MINQKAQKSISRKILRDDIEKLSFAEVSTVIARSNHRVQGQLIDAIKNQRAHKAGEILNDMIIGYLTTRASADANALLADGSLIKKEVDQVFK